MVAELHRLRHGVAEPRQHAGDVLLVALGPIQLLEAVPVGDDAGKRGAERIPQPGPAASHSRGPPCWERGLPAPAKLAKAAL